MKSEIKKGLFILSLVVFSSVLSLSIPFMVSGVSVSPASVKLDFVPGKVYTGTARFGTEPERTSHLAITTEGDLDIKVDKKELFCDREPCSVDYEVTMPESFDRPGGHKSYIIATEVFDEERSNFINVVVSMKMPIRTFQPYPGKYLKFISLEATNREAGEEIPFKAKIASKGDDVINSATGTFLIYDRFNEMIGSVNTRRRTNIQPGEEFVMLGKWNSGTYEKGRYYANMIINYDGKKVNKTIWFKLGGLDVELMNYTREVIIGGIKPFYLTVESIWSEDIDSMKARVSVLNKTSSEELIFFDAYLPLGVTLRAWKKADLKGYLDTTNLHLGDYDLRINLSFENLTKEYKGSLSIIEEFVPEPPKEPWFKKIFTLKNILIILITLLVLVIIFFIYSLVPKKKRFKKEKVKKKVGGK